MMLNPSTTRWYAYENGRTVGQRGSEQGVILQDEAYAEGARITLEHNSSAAPFAITCGVSGWLVHTRYFHDELTAKQSFEEMKAELEKILALIPSEENATEDQLRSVTSALLDFTKRFP